MSFTVMEALESIDKATKIANNALYFDDSSDYQTALWEILAVLNPEKYNDTDEIIEYIEED